MVKGIVTKINIQPLLNLKFDSFSSKIKLQKALTKSGGLLCSKNNGLAKLSNHVKWTLWCCDVITSPCLNMVSIN